MFKLEITEIRDNSVARGHRFRFQEKGDRTKMYASRQGSHKRGCGRRAGVEEGTGKT